MFPVVEVILSGLGNWQIYEIILEFVPIGTHKYKFEHGQPNKNGNAEAFNESKGNLLIPVAQKTCG